jgi:hypothetical protein
MSPNFFFYILSHNNIYQEFKDTGKTFSEYAKELIQSHDSLAIRRINDAIMKVSYEFQLKGRLLYINVN